MKHFKGQIIILASRSPWRKRLLERHGIPCRVHVSAFEEIKKHVSPRRLVLENARGKAFDVARHYLNKRVAARPHVLQAGRVRLTPAPYLSAALTLARPIVIGVDTIGVLGKKILGKPRNRSGARAMLISLRGRAHSVITGLCVVDVKTGKKFESVVSTKVKFRKFSSEELERYLDSGQWKGKAGSYAIQGRAKGFVEKIDGDLTNVVGLPIGELRKILKKFLISM